MRIEPGQHREKRAGGVIFEPMGREKAPGVAARKVWNKTPLYFKCF